MMHAIANWRNRNDLVLNAIKMKLLNSTLPSGISPVVAKEVNQKLSKITNTNNNISDLAGNNLIDCFSFGSSVNIWSI